MTGEDILLGIALTVALATGSQILANKLRVPALIILLPVGFTAGALTWVIGLGKALETAGLDVLMWAGLEEERERITTAGIELAHGEMLATATKPRARLEGVTAVFLLTDDDFNALASTVIKDNVRGPVYRVGPPRDSHGVVAPYTGGDILFGRALVRHRLAARYEHGARFHVQPGSQPIPSDRDILFVVRADGQLVPVTGTQTITPRPGNTAVLMGSA